MFAFNINKFCLYVFMCLIATAMFLAMPSAKAETRKLQIKGSVFHIDIPAGWDVAPGLYGAPYALLGPEKKGEAARPVVMIAGGDHPPKDVIFTKEEFEKTYDAYLVGTKLWITKVKAALQEYLPYENSRTLASDEMHSWGVRYQLQGANFRDQSFYINCKGKVFYFKTLLRDVHLKAHLKTIHDLVGSFSCE